MSIPAERLPRAEPHNNPGPRRILMVGDDRRNRQSTTKVLRAEFAGVDISFLSTEKEFREWMDQFDPAQDGAELTPDIVLMSVMLPWFNMRKALPTPLASPPDDVLEGGQFRAGFRCARMWASNPLTKDIPMIMYTLLLKAELAEDLRRLPRGNNIHFLHKVHSDRLPDVMRGLVAPQQAPQR